MTTSTRPKSQVKFLPSEITSLARFPSPHEPGTLLVLGVNGGMSVPPDSRFRLVFGRNEPDVHVCVGVDDPHVSRQHGFIYRDHSRWVLDNVGKLPIRFPDGNLVLGGNQAVLKPGYQPLFVVSSRREHLLEVRVVTAEPDNPDEIDPEDSTCSRAGWPLNDLERLVLVSLAQRYLRNEPQPQPLTWAQVADELGELEPEAHWSWRKAARVVTKVRERLSPWVDGLLEKDVTPPIGNTLNHNLITELVATTTIAKSDLAVLEDGSPQPAPPPASGSRRLRSRIIPQRRPTS